MSVADIVVLTEFETGASDWSEGSQGLCWPHYFELYAHFHRKPNALTNLGDVEGMR